MARIRRSPTCRWCYATGHNSSGCPRKKDYIAANPDSWVAHQAKQKAVKSCSYCSGQGHTRVTCEELKEYTRLKRIRLLENRETVCNALIELGIGPGALVETETYNNKLYTWSKTLCLVEGIKWDIVADERGASRYILDVRDFHSQKPHTVALPRHAAFDNEYSNDTKMISGISSEFAEKYNRKLMAETAEIAYTHMYIPKRK